MSYGALYEIYGNYQVLNQDGKLIFRCDQKKFDWYIRKNLAEKIDDYTIRLNFVANGDGWAWTPSLLPARENVCAVCGSTTELNRHHVVPYCYRRFFPDEIKKHNHYDILAVCTYCHDRYEAGYAIARKTELAERFNAPLNGSGVLQESLTKYIASRSAYAIKNHRDRMPEQRLKSHLKNLQVYLGRDPADEDIHSLSEVSLSRYCKGSFYKHHGEIVVSRLEIANDFVQEWRKHFIESMNPQFLPEGWCVEGPKKEVPNGQKENSDRPSEEAAILARPDGQNRG